MTLGTAQRHTTDSYPKGQDQFTKRADLRAVCPQISRVLEPALEPAPEPVREPGLEKVGKRLVEGNRHARFVACWLVERRL